MLDTAKENCKMKLGELINDLSEVMDKLGEDTEVLFYHIDDPTNKFDLSAKIFEPQDGSLDIELVYSNLELKVFIVQDPPRAERREPRHAVRSYNPQRML